MCFQLFSWRLGILASLRWIRLTCPVAAGVSRLQLQIGNNEWTHVRCYDFGSGSRNRPGGRFAALRLGVLALNPILIDPVCSLMPAAPSFAIEMSAGIGNLV